MSESPRSENLETRFSTPVPELDDHRYQPDSLARAEAGAEAPPSRRNTAQYSARIGSVDRSDLLHINEALREAGSISRDFEHAVVDDDRSALNVEGVAGRRMSINPIDARRHTRPDRSNRSTGPSISSRSSSPPNSVEAFAEPRRRERANTLDSYVQSDVEGILHRTVSAGTQQPRRPTFSNAGAVRPENLDSKLDPAETACYTPGAEQSRSPIIDYEELEEFVALSKQKKPRPGVADSRKHSLSSQGKHPRIFPDLRPSLHKAGLPHIVTRSPSRDRSSECVANSDDNLEKTPSKPIDEKDLFKILQNENGRNRFSFFSSESQSTVHATEIGDLVLPGDTFRDLFELGPEGGAWWLDVFSPTEDEVGAISRAFAIHPLTSEDILTQEAREKVELFKHYYFVCFRTFYQLDKSSEDYLEPVNLYMVVFRQGVITFSFTENPHASNVRKRIGQLRDYVSLSSDWICYAMIDDIVDSFGPVMCEVEKESEVIEDHVYIARLEDFNTFLPQIGGLRKKVMSLMRLIGGKADVIKGFAKRCNEQYSITPRGDIGLYLGDIQDHVVTMMSNLAHVEKMLSRSHANYLAQLNVCNIQVGNHVNRMLTKITLLATILVPLNLICGLFGMNVPVPGDETSGLGWFFGILGVIAVITVASVGVARRYDLV